MIIKRSLIYTSLFLFLFFNAIIISFIPADYVPYAVTPYIGLLIISFLIDPFALVRSKSGYLLYSSFLILHIILLAYYGYRQDFDSVLNLFALIAAYLGSYSITTAAVQFVKPYDLLRSLLSVCLPLLVIAMLLSIVMTFIGSPTAPPYYPWEALFSEKRLLILAYTTNSDRIVGHSIAIWLAGFALIDQLAKRGTLTIKRLLIMSFLVVVLLLSKTRTGLMLILLPSFAIILTSKTRVRPKIIAIFLAIIPGTYFLISSNPNVVLKISDVFFAVQQLASPLRIYGSDGSEVSAFTGRDLLNQALYDSIYHAPFAGVGDGAPIINSGINYHGDIADESGFDRIAGTESGLRITIKYGVIYTFILALIAFFPFYKSDRIMESRTNWVETNWNLTIGFGYYALLVVAMLDGVFENPKGSSAFFFIFLFLFWQIAREAYEMPNSNSPSYT